MKLALPAVAAAVALVNLAAPARADVIDGTWCYKNQSLSIDGPNILTPGRNATTGNYQRHSFDYTAPLNERDSGSAVHMILLNEDTMNLWVGAAYPQDNSVQVWLRCAPIS
jgi:hypothetical protein